MMQYGSNEMNKKQINICEAMRTRLMWEIWMKIVLFSVMELI